MYNAKRITADILPRELDPLIPIRYLKIDKLTSEKIDKACAFVKAGNNLIEAHIIFDVEFVVFCHWIYTAIRLLHTRKAPLTPQERLLVFVFYSAWMDATNRTMADVLKKGEHKRMRSINDQKSLIKKIVERFYLRDFRMSLN